MFFCSVKKLRSKKAICRFLVDLIYNFHPKYVTFCLRLVKISPTA